MSERVVVRCYATYEDAKRAVDRLTVDEIAEAYVDSIFHGVLAPHATRRAAIIPQPAQKHSAPVHEHTHGNAARMSRTPGPALSRLA